MAAPDLHPTAFESQILTSFLLDSSSLSSIVSPSYFTSLFPAKHRSNPQIQLLYRELQLARSRQCKSVQKAIDTEAKVAGPRLRAALAERRKVLGNGNAGEREEGEGVLDGIELFGAPAAAQPRMPLKELLEAMERALEDLEDERMRMEEECDAVLEKVKTVVGEMSDLRYGKLANPGTEKQAMAQLKYLTEVCERKLAAADEVAGGGGTDVDRDVEMS